MKPVYYLIHQLKRLTRWRLSPEERRHSLVGRPELWRMKRNFQIGFLKNAGLKPHHLFLDIGCGTLRGGLPVIDYLETGCYYGIDIREEAIAEANNELAEAGLSAKEPALIHFTDFKAFDLDRDFDFMWAFSVLIHLSDDILADCLLFAGRRLKSGGVFYANVNLGERKEGYWQGFPVVFRSLDFYSEQAGAYGLVVEEIGDLASLGHDSGKAGQDAQVMLKFSKR